ncbi:MAG: DUF5672 family protein [Burkholderiales bacterium]
MLALPTVTLVAIDTAHHALALRALARSCTGIRFARALFLTDAVPPGAAVPDGVEVVPIAPILSRDDYSRFVLKALAPYVATPHALLIQWDGYVVNPSAWDPAFLACDYLGATWFWRDDDMRVGNGGFSLRSRRLLEATRDARVEPGEAEDTAICRTHRPLLEREFGIRFGSEALAERFAFETDYPVGRPFGFHGLFNFWRVMRAPELAALAPMLSDAVARSPQCDQLLHNCALAGFWLPAAAIARRVLAAMPGNDEARAILADADAEVARLAGAGPSEPCPCRSGHTFGTCHGRPGARSLLDPELPQPTADEYVERGARAHHAGEVAGAGREYRAALAAAPGHPVALHNLGLVELQSGRSGRAIELLERAVRNAPDEPAFLTSLGQALAAGGRVDEAIVRYRAALARQPANAVAWHALGLALHAARDLPQAISALREAIRLAPGFAPAQAALAELLDESRTG